MDHRVAAQLLPQFLLHIVDLIVEGQHILVGGHLRVEGDHHPAGAVVVDDQIVDAHDPRVGHHKVVDLLDQLAAGGRPQQGVQGLLGGLDAGPQDEHRHQHAHPAVDHQVREVGHQGGQQHGGGGHAVTEGVRGGGQHGGGVQPLPQPAVIGGHVQLHPDGDAQDGNHQRAGVHRRRVQDLVQGGPAQLVTHQQDQQRHRQAGQVLHPPVAERVLRVRLLARQAEAHQRHEGAAGVGEVIEGVGGDGDGAGEGARQEFSQEQQDVQPDPHRAAEDAVAPAEDGGLLALRLQKQPRQK